VRHRRSWRVLGIALLIAWQFAVFAAFYLIQKPFGLDMARAAMRCALDIAVALAIVGMGSALGRRFLIWLGLSDIGTGDVVWLAPALGLGGLSLISLGMGLVGVWRRPFIYGLALLAIGVLAKDGCFWDDGEAGTWR
jgi:hypothetical protein